MNNKERMPLWLAVGITVVVSLPFGLWFGHYNLPLWVAFVVWAEYFALGATPAALKTIVPAYILGVLGAVLICTAAVLLTNVMPNAKVVSPGDLPVFITFFIGFCVLIYAMKFLPVTQTGTLPFFNGISMALGTYFTAQFVAPFGTNVAPALLPLVTGLGAILAGLLGAFLGWFNVAIMAPRKSAAAQPSPSHDQEATAR